MWAQGRQDGIGVYYAPDGRSRKGLWKEGIRVKWLDDLPDGISDT
jgi:hypothetical protein